MATLARARPLFEAVVDLPEPERTARLRALCGGDDALFDIVWAMLDVDGQEMGLDSGQGSSVPLVLAAEVLDFEVPERLGRYRVLRELGRGGMGIVYEAEQEVPHRRVALKTLPTLTAALDRNGDDFRREVDAMARVDHPGIPRIYEVFVEDGRSVMAMELVEGVDLVTALDGRDQRARLLVLERLCDAIQAAHDAGVVHRDLKPSNVILDPRDQPRVLDFGIASLTGEAREGAGTRDYASPEQLAGAPPDPRMDTYALGLRRREAKWECDCRPRHTRRRVKQADREPLTSVHSVSPRRPTPAARPGARAAPAPRAGR